MTTARGRGTVVQDQELQRCNSEQSALGIAGTVSKPKISGWARALAEAIDDVVVDRLVNGQSTPCTAWERRAAVVRLHHRRWSAVRIATWLDMPERQVCRDLERAGLSAVGLLRQRQTAAAQRRRAVARLHTAGARVCEMAVLLHANQTVIGRDLVALNLSSRPQHHKPCPPRHELLAKFGHLIHQPAEEAC